MGLGRALVLLPALLLAACTVTPPQLTYLQLSAGNVSPGTGPGPSVYLEAVKLPDFLLRDVLLERIDEHQVNYRETQRWAEPLDIGIQRVLREQLSAQLDSSAVHSYPSPRPETGHWRIALDIAHFEADSAGLHLDAQATLKDVSGDAVVRTDHRVERLHIERRRELASQNTSAIAASMSDLLRELAAQLASALREAGANTAPDAPINATANP